MLSFARFMNTPAGRWTRVIGGVAMIVAGLAGLGGLAGAILAVIGLIPLAAGVFDLCLLAPLLHTPLSGAKVRPILVARDRASKSV